MVLKISMIALTESFKGLGVNPYWFYLVIGIRWALMKYHIKLLGKYDKNKRFSPRPLWVWFVFIPVETKWALLKNPKRFLLKPSWLPH